LLVSDKPNFSINQAPLSSKFFNTFGPKTDNLITNFSKNTNYCLREKKLTPLKNVFFYKNLKFSLKNKLIYRYITVNNFNTNFMYPVWCNFAYFTGTLRVRNLPFKKKKQKF
jgi:hypothetical protein